jgi:CheY-like chemotaxis protein
LLESRGYECEEAETGFAATSQLRTSRFDAVITDHQMPVMSGVELLEWLATAPEIEDLPVILLSADLSEQGLRRAWQAGVCSILAKPFDCEELVSLVARVVRGGKSA